MTDRELLEMAAKAAGVEGKYFGSDNPIHTGIYQARGEYYWNPLISDSEALRLAVKLKLELDLETGNKVATTAYYESDTVGAWKVCEPHGTDPYAATRRAIVRAAAALAVEHTEGKT